MCVKDMEAAMTRILIADDNQDIVDILTRFARKEDLKVDAASDDRKPWIYSERRITI